MKEFDSRDLELLRTPLKTLRRDPISGYISYANEEEYIERDIYDFAVKIRRLVSMISSKSKNLNDIVAQYYVSNLTDDEFKALDIVFYNLSRKIAEYEEAHDKAIKDFYKELY